MKCLNCANEITSKYATKFCGLSCSNAFNVRGQQRNLQSGKYAIKPCLVCGVSTTNPKYCSKACMGQTFRKYETEDERLAKKRAKQRADYALYQSRKKHMTTIGSNLQAIRDFYFKCPDGYEVDHVMPLSKGGSHDISNLQYLTISENRRKGNRIIAGDAKGEQLVS